MAQPIIFTIYGLTRLLEPDLEVLSQPSPRLVLFGQDLSDF